MTSPDYTARARELAEALLADWSEYAIQRNARILASALREAAAEEREACADIASEYARREASRIDDYARGNHNELCSAGREIANDIAASLRARGSGR